MPQKFSHYAVKRGHSTGVFTNWGAVLDAITDFDKPEFRGFYSKEAAQSWLDGKSEVGAAKEYDLLIEQALAGDRTALQKAAKLLTGKKR